MVKHVFTILLALVLASGCAQLRRGRAGLTVAPRTFVPHCAIGAPRRAAPPQAKTTGPSTYQVNPRNYATRDELKRGLDEISKRILDAETKAANRYVDREALASYATAAELQQAYNASQAHQAEALRASEAQQQADLDATRGHFTEALTIASEATAAQVVEQLGGSSTIWGLSSTAALALGGPIGIGFGVGLPLLGFALRRRRERREREEAGAGGPPPRPFELDQNQGGTTGGHPPARREEPTEQPGQVRPTQERPTSGYSPGNNQPAPEGAANHQEGPAAADGFPQLDDRSDSYGRELVRLHQLESRNPLHDATRGRLADQELEQLLEGDDKMAARVAQELKDRLDRRFNEIHPLAVRLPADEGEESDADR